MAMRFPWRRPRRHRLVPRRVERHERGYWLHTYECERCGQFFPVTSGTMMPLGLSLWEPCPGRPREVLPSVAQAGEVVPHDGG